MNAEAGPASASPGVALAAARKAQGLTVEDVAGQLKLSPRQIEALEAERFGDLPGAVFVRGFLRNYARLLHLDPGPLLASADPMLEPGVPLVARATSGVIPQRGRKGAPWWIYGVAVLAVVLAAAAYETWWSRPAEVRAIPAEKVAAEPPPAPAVPAPVPETPAAQAVESAPAAVEPPPSATPGARPEEHRVKLYFQRDAWVEVRDREGRVIHSRLNAAGSEQTIEAEPPLAFVVGNASAVRMTYNEKPFDLAPHAKVNVARFNLE